MEVAKGFTDVLYTTMVLLFNEIFVPVMTEILSLFYEKAMYVLSHSVSMLSLSLPLQVSVYVRKTLV